MLRKGYLRYFVFFSDTKVILTCVSLLRISYCYSRLLMKTSELMMTSCYTTESWRERSMARISEKNGKRAKYTRVRMISGVLQRPVTSYNLLQWIPGSFFPLHRFNLSEIGCLVGTVHPISLDASFCVQLALKGQKLNKTAKTRTHVTALIRDQVRCPVWEEWRVCNHKRCLENPTSYASQWLRKDSLELSAPVSRSNLRHLLSQHEILEAKSILYTAETPNRKVIMATKSPLLSIQQVSQGDHASSINQCF